MSSSSVPVAEKLEYKQAVAPAQYTAAITGTEVDASNALKSVTFLISTGAIAAADANNLLTFSVQQATSSGGSFSTVVSNQYSGTANAWDKLINAISEANGEYRLDIELAAGYPYLKLMAAKTGTVDIYLGAVCIFETKATPTT